MKTLENFVFPAHDKKAAREKIEWANFWYSQANNASLPEAKEKRILLVGDSTVRMVRSSLERRLNIPVDMIGTSSGLHDILFVKQFNAFFSSPCYNNYSAIFVQLGHHSIANDEGCTYLDQDYIRFRKDYVGMLSFLRQFSSNIILLSCFLNVTPISEKTNGLKKIPIFLWRKIFGEKIDYSWSSVVEKKNKIVEEIAKEQGLKFCDIDGIIRAQCQGLLPKYIHRDHIHYENKAKKEITEIYASLI